MSARVRELTRDSVRFHIAESVFGFFLENGFDETTVEDAARAAGISRATFFRYFRSKEDAVIATMQASELDFAATLRASELPSGQPRWIHMRAAFEPAVVAVEADPVRLHARAHMIISIASLRAHLAERRRLQEDRLVEAVRGQVADVLTAQVLVVAALAAFDLAWREWAADPDADFRGVLDRVFDRLAQV